MTLDPGSWEDGGGESVREFALVLGTTEVAPRPACANAGCTRVAARRGLCSPCYRRALADPSLPMPLPLRRALAEPDEAPALAWEREDAAAAARRRALCTAIDRVLTRVEVANLGGDPEVAASVGLVVAYRAVGGEREWLFPPTGAELHDALLSLQEAALRRPALLR